MLGGRLPLWSANWDRDLYDSNTWPNLDTFVAGTPWKTQFPLDRRFFDYIWRPINMEQRAQARFFWGTVAIGGTALAIYYVLKKMK
jgi:hypothetical protein